MQPTSLDTLTPSVPSAWKGRRDWNKQKERRARMRITEGSHKHKRKKVKDKKKVRRNTT